jgi:glycosyltransferase involved in cell wall biosynthesis
VKKKHLYYLILSISFCSLATLAVFGLYVFRINKTKKPVQTRVFKSGISVIICAHNEANNLLNFLPKILQQDYATFEVIVVNDRSTDDTLKVLRQLSNLYSTLKILSIDHCPTEWNPKKWALKQGVAKAENKYLLFTDADCYPNSNQWIKKMSQGFLDASIVLGYGSYEKRKGLLNKLIQYETYQTAIAMFGLSELGFNFIGIGRNFGCQKSIYQNFDWGENKSKTGGDDDLFVNQSKIKITNIIDPDTQIISVPELNWSDYFQQKIRHISVSTNYSLKSKLIIGAYNTSLSGFYLSIVLFMAFNCYPILISLLILRTLILFLNFVIAKKSLKIKLIALESVYLDIIYTLFIWTIGPIALKAKKVRWK